VTVYLFQGQWCSLQY